MSLLSHVGMWLRDADMLVALVKSIYSIFFSNLYTLFLIRCVAYKSMNVGKLLTMQFNADEPFMLATGGDKGMVAIWESDEQEYIKNHFESRVVAKNANSETYAALVAARDGSSREEGAAATSAVEAVPKSDMSELTAQINTPKAPVDDSWMDDNTGIETGASSSNSGNGEKTKKKKNKNKDKK